MKTAILWTMAASATVLVAQQTASLQSSPGDLDRRVRARVLADIARMPNYTCVQTVTRSVYRPATPRFRLCDEIIADRKGSAAAARESVLRESLLRESLLRESWDRLRLVGAARFEDVGLYDLVGYSHTSTGEFGPFLLSIFGGDTAIDFAGERSMEGRRLWDYTYTIPAADSDYRIKVGSGEFVTPYSGAVLLDPETGDVFRVTVRSAALPEASGYCQTDNTLDYARVKIGANNALIPLATTANAIDRDGNELLNETSYGSCREYIGESKLSFESRFNDENAKAASKNQPPVEFASIPVGVLFESRITTPINSETSAMGDPVEAVLRSRIAGLNGRTIIPAGAHIHGRLTLFGERTSAGKDVYEVGIQFLAIDVGGGRVPLRADLLGVRTADTSTGVGIFRFPGGRLRLDGLDAKWITSAPPRELPVREFPKF